MYDFSAVITRIEEALEQSKLAASQAEQEATQSRGTGSRSHRRRASRRESSQRLADRLTVAVEWIDETGAALGAVGPAVAVEREAAVGAAPAPAQHLEQRPARRVRRASRTRQRRRPSGLVDPISRSSCPRASSDAAWPTVDSLGVKYETAAAFDQPVNELIAAGEEPTDATMRLAELVATVEAHAERGTSPAELRAEFEAGVLDMITAREVRLRDVPVVENDGRESVYFTIPTSDDDPGRPAGDVQRERSAVRRGLRGADRRRRRRSLGAAPDRDDETDAASARGCISHLDAARGQRSLHARANCRSPSTGPQSADGEFLYSVRGVHLDGRASPHPSTVVHHDPVRAALDCLAEGFQIIDADWKYVYVNPAAARHGRREAAALIGTPMADAYPGIDQTPLFGVLRTCMETTDERGHREPLHVSRRQHAVVRAAHPSGAGRHLHLFG